MATVTSFTAEHITELMAGWEGVAQDQAAITTLVTTLQNEVNAFEVTLNELTTVTNPALEAQLAANAILVSELNDTTVPNLQAELTLHEADLLNLNTVHIPQLQAELTSNSNWILELNDTTLPALNTRLDAAETDVAALEGKFPITAPDIAAGAVTANAIFADAVTTNAIAAGAVTAAEIAADTITANEIAAGTITASEIAAGAITTTKLAADAVTANEIAADTITAAEIAAGAITATEIAANTITAAEIAAGAITADEIAANAVTATKIAADAIDGKTITGALFRTAATGQRLEMDGVSTIKAFKGYAADGTTQTVNIDGVDNYIEGAFATADDGPRVEIIQDGSLGKINFYSNLSDEEHHAGNIYGAQNSLVIGSPSSDLNWLSAQISLFAGDGTRDTDPNGSPQLIKLDAEEIWVGHPEYRQNPVQYAHTVLWINHQTVDIVKMGAGSVGTGTFRDSVDARVTAVAPTVTMTTGGVGTGAFRDSVDARVAAVRILEPHRKVNRDTSQAMDSSGWETVFWPNTDINRGGISVASGVFTLPKAGRYLIQSRIVWQASSTGRRALRIRHNNSVVNDIDQQALSTSTALGMQISYPVLAAANDTIDIQGWHNVAALDVITGSYAIVTYLGE